MKLGSWILGSGTLMAVSEPANALVAAWSGPSVPLLAVAALAVLTWHSERWRGHPDA